MATSSIINMQAQKLEHEESKIDAIDYRKVTVITGMQASETARIYIQA
jgi:hypothetical protein